MLKATVERIDGSSAVLRLPSGSEISVPLEGIEGRPVVGQVVALLAVAVGSEDAGRQRIAHDLLNELLTE